MGALQARAILQAGGDTYLCPLAEVQLPPEVLAGYLAPFQTGQQPFTRITRVTSAGKPEHIPDGYERAEYLTADVAGTARAVGSGESDPDPVPSAEVTGGARHWAEGCRQSPGVAHGDWSDGLAGICLRHDA